MSCSPCAPYARMSQQVYRNNGGTPPPGFITVSYNKNNSNGFQGAAYYNPTSSELVVAFAGTDPLILWMAMIGGTTFRSASRTYPPSSPARWTSTKRQWPQ